jgi:predicted permease
VNRGSARRSLVSRLVIASQLALSLTLIFCAGLFMRTLHNLRAIDLGFLPESLILLPIDLRSSIHAGPAAKPFLDELLRRVRDLQGVRAAAFSNLVPLSGNMSGTTIDIPAYVSPNGAPPVTNVAGVSEGFFRTLAIPLIAGRDFTGADTPTGEAVIVNETFAQRFFNGNALGKTFTFRQRQVRVAGVVGTARYRYIREEPQAVLYMPTAQAISIEIRATGDSVRAMEQIRALVNSLDPHIPTAYSTMEMQLDQVLGRERLMAFLSSLLASVAAILAAIGLYGVVSFSVARRMRETGIRLAIGARRGQIVALFLGENTLTVVGGVVVGIPLALASGRLATSLLYGLKPQDTTTAVAAVGMLVVVAAMAALVPAWRAARVDPSTALRHE